MERPPRDSPQKSESSYFLNPRSLMSSLSVLRRVSFGQHRTRILYVALFVVALYALVTLAHFQTTIRCDSPYANVYDVVIDAGSTGSRVYVFHFERSQSGFSLLAEWFKRVEPGLSSFASNPSDAAESVSSLVDYAVSVVPADYHQCTSIVLRATAGLRLLPNDESKTILRLVDQALSQSPLNSRGASVMPGLLEGVFGWMTVNYLLRSLDEGTSSITLEMGGASAQLVFQTDPAIGQWLPFNYAYPFRTPLRKMMLYQHSYLGFGLNEAKKSLLSAIWSLQPAEADHFPCLVRGESIQTNDYTFSNKGEAYFDECVELFRQHVFLKTACAYPSCGIKDIPQPPLPVKEHPLYAFSYFYDRLQPFRDEDSPVVVSTFKNAGQKACTMPPDEKKNNYCMDLAYLYSFLSIGLGLADSTPLNVPNRIAKKAVSWTLGSSIAFLLHIEP